MKQKKNYQKHAVNELLLEKEMGAQSRRWYDNIIKWTQLYLGSLNWASQDHDPWSELDLVSAHSAVGGECSMMILITPDKWIQAQTDRTWGDLVAVYRVMSPHSCTWLAGMGIRKITETDIRTCTPAERGESLSDIAVENVWSTFWIWVNTPCRHSNILVGSNWQSTRLTYYIMLKHSFLYNH